MQEGSSAVLADADKQEGDEEGEESDVIGDEETEEEGNASEEEEVKAAIPIPVQPKDHRRTKTIRREPLCRSVFSPVPIPCRSSGPLGTPRL